MNKSTNNGNEILVIYSCGKDFRNQQSVTKIFLDGLTISEAQNKIFATIEQLKLDMEFISDEEMFFSSQETIDSVKNLEKYLNEEIRSDGTRNFKLVPKIWTDSLQEIKKQLDIKLLNQDASLSFANLNQQEEKLAKICSSFIEEQTEHDNPKVTKVRRELQLIRQARDYLESIEKY